MRALAAAVTVVAVVGAPGVAMAFNPQPDPPADADLLGRVTDACTAHPIGEVQLTLAPTSGEATNGNNLRSLTNDGGHYLFKGLASGDYALRVSPPQGYKPPSSDERGFRVTVSTSGGTTHLDLSLVPAVQPGPC
jgi:hypothetical protein